MQCLFLGRHKHAEEVQACHIGKIRHVPYYFHQMDSNFISDFSFASNSLNNTIITEMHIT
jgi:hypothetical protein